MSYIPFAKPRVSFSEDERKEVIRILEGGQWAKGQYVQELKEYCEDRFNSEYILLCSSCTQCMLLVLQKFKNDIVDLLGTVGIPAFTWPSIEYVLYTIGTKYKHLDVDKRTWMVTKNNIIDDVDTVIPTDIFGSIAKLPKVKQFVLYDAAHSFGNKLLGNRETAAEFVSFSFTKPITGMTGGLAILQSEFAYETLQEKVDLSAKMLEIQAYMILHEIKYEEEKYKKRIEAIEMYRYYLKKNGVKFIEQKIPIESNYSTYSILFKEQGKRDAVVNEFFMNDIEVKTYYKPLVKGLPNTDFIYSNIISLPIHTLSEIERICTIISEA